MSRLDKHVFTPDASVFPMHHDSPSEEAMRQGFIEVATEVANDADAYGSDLDTFLAGMELEMPLVDINLNLCDQALRDQVVREVPNTQVELPGHQIEVTPVAPADLKSNLMSLESGMAQSMQPMLDMFRRLGLYGLRIGSYPLCQIDDVQHTAGEPKYAKYDRSPKWHIDNQRPSLIRTIPTDSGDLDISNAMVVGLMSAIQVTVDGTSMDDAIDKLNRSFMISPMATALGAHSTHLAFTDTGHADVRFVAWRTSHDSRTEEEVRRGMPTRVGLPNQYFTSLDEYFNNILSYPFILNDENSLKHPFEVGNGLYWPDARLKFFRDKQKVGVEFRPIPLQPSLHEDIAMVLFYVGRLVWSQATNESLMDMHVVRANKESAMKTSNGGSSLIVEIARADAGLSMLGADLKTRAYYLGTLRDRVKFGNPAFLFRQACGLNAGNVLEREEQIRRAIAARNLVER